MGRRIKITVHKFCETATDRNNELCQILDFKFPERADVLITRFESYLGLPFDWSSITVSNLVKFKTYIQQDMSLNASATNCAWLAAVIRVYCQDHGIGPDKYCKVLTLKREKGIFVAVKPEEIQRLEEFYRNENEDIEDRTVAALALLEYYTGARNSDSDGFTTSNITSGTYIDKNTGESKQRLVISYSSEKTNIKANIPVKPIVQEILSNRTGSDIVIDNGKFNRRIKAIFEKIGLDREVFEHRAGQDVTKKLYEVVTSHSFRRSFATTLNDRGVNIEMISRMMGHTNAQQTRGYICGQNLVLDEKAMEFFD